MQYRQLYTRSEWQPSSERKNKLAERPPPRPQSDRTPSSSDRRGSERKRRTGGGSVERTAGQHSQQRATEGQGGAQAEGKAKQPYCVSAPCPCSCPVPASTSSWHRANMSNQDRPRLFCESGLYVARLACK
ncbi:hypothetical protein C8T65DRAFT_640210 [Cerioporus squamosus]|nr:hypothetical protein C8T65DRAFT_640210 [Cerioporus squamosus]